MAVVSARRMGADRVAKDKYPQSRSHHTSVSAKKMSFPSVAGEQQGQINPSDPNASFPVPRTGSDRDSLRKRKASKSKTVPDLRRSASTPHLGKAMHGDTSLLSAAEQKKRNKLGYHRTSIACSHCRRRKIRCQLPLPEDPQGRCTNCIRLKKECNFYPVDQGPAIEHGTGQTLQKEVAAPVGPSGSSHSSPHISGTSQPSSIPDDTQGHLSSPKLESDPQQQHETGGFGLPNVTGVNPQSTPYSFASPIGSSWTDSPQGIDHLQHRSSVVDQHFWSTNNTPTTGHFSHEPGMPYIPTTPSAFTSQGGPQPFIPSRSMSFGQVEGMPQHHNYQGYQYNHGMQPGYSIPQIPQYRHQNTQQGVISHNAVPDEIPRSWSNAPNMAYPTAGNVLNSPYYPQPQSFHAYDARGEPAYHQQQYYPATTHPD